MKSDIIHSIYREHTSSSVVLNTNQLFTIKQRKRTDSKGYLPAPTGKEFEAINDNVMDTHPYFIHLKLVILLFSNIFVIGYIAWLCYLYYQSSLFYDHQCGNIILHLSFVYLYNNNVMECIIAISIAIGNAGILFVICTTYYCQKMEMRRIKDDKVNEIMMAQLKRKSIILEKRRSTMRLTGYDTDDDNHTHGYSTHSSDYATEYSANNDALKPGVKKVLHTRHRSHMQVLLNISSSDSTKKMINIEECTCIHSVVYIFGWLFTLCLTMIYFIGLNLPDNNVLKLQKYYIYVIRYGLCVLLTFCSLFLVPKVSDILIMLHIYMKARCNKTYKLEYSNNKVCCPCFTKCKPNNEHFFDANDTNDYKTVTIKLKDSKSFYLKNLITPSRLHRYRTIMNAILRSINIVWIPLIVSVLFSNNCGFRFWSKLWVPCINGNENDYNFMNINMDMRGAENYQNYTIKYGYLSKISIKDDICGTDIDSWDHVYSNKRCIRDILGDWGEIVLIKCVFTMMVYLLRLITIKWECCFQNFWMKWSPKLKIDNDYSSILSHLEISIIFGFIMPYIIPLIGVTLLLLMLTYHISLKKGREFETYLNEENSKQTLKYPVLYLLYPLILSNVLIILFYHSNQLNGFEILLYSCVSIDIICIILYIYIKCKCYIYCDKKNRQ